MFKTKDEPSVEDLPELYTSGDVAAIAGVSLRQLQWWDERGVVSPQQVGHRRVYLRKEVAEVSVIAELRRKGFSLQKIRRVLKFLQREMGDRLGSALDADNDIHLLTDGKNIYLEDEPGRVIDVLKNAKQPMFLVCVTDQIRRFHAAAPAVHLPLEPVPEPIPARKPVASERNTRATGRVATRRAKVG
jgi:DNA-binding transcriptional MerR regulator